MPKFTAVVSDGSGKVAVSVVTSTEIGYLDGVSSAIQTQLNAKAPLAGATFTGQVNMSRISHKLLTIEIKPINSTHDNDTRVYAINYNVLRFESGLAGLKF